MTAAQAKAHAQGAQAGRDPQSTAALCPYPYNQRDLRMAWYDGFSEGRMALARDKRPAQG